MKSKEEIIKLVAEEFGLPEQTLAWLMDKENGPYAGTLTQKLWLEVVAQRRWIEDETEG
jgi:hypothetical protein